jgi:putative FmdB family regulatory protein
MPIYEFKCDKCEAITDVALGFDAPKEVICQNCGVRMGEQGEIKRRIHSIRYIRQMLEWGFDKEFIARDMGISLSSLETRLRRAKVREQENEQRKKLR